MPVPSGALFDALASVRAHVVTPAIWSVASLHVMAACVPLGRRSVAAATSSSRPSFSEQTTFSANSPFRLSRAGANGIAFPRLKAATTDLRCMSALTAAVRSPVFVACMRSGATAPPPRRPAAVGCAS
eukprot:scaffold51470_cov53-Phaeocystis_antarctica.AAC.1